MFSVKRYVVLTHLICHNCHLAVRSCNPSEPFWDQQRPRGTVWGYGHNSQLARMRLEVNVKIFGKPSRAEFENEARGGRDGGGFISS